jgi:HAUS augmin-like complex subunit 1
MPNLRIHPSIEFPNNKTTQTMDPNLELLPSALFSPSKAAQQRAQAQDWHHVDTWLSSKHQGRTVPTFERNEDTLRTLLALVAANEKADEERDLLLSIQKEALAELKADTTIDHTPHSRQTIVNKLTTTLSDEGRANLDAISTLSVAIDSPSPTSEAIANALISQTETSHTLTQHLLRLTHLQRRLETELLSLRSQLQQLRSPVFQPPISLARQTLDWTRNTKQLRAKLSEYNDRLSSLSSDTAGSQGGILIEEIVRREAQILDLGERVEVLERQVDKFRGLPGDIQGARNEVARVEKEVVGLKRRRDDLFEGLVEKA